jgi:phage host-nuclease inhibitor protein Gam
MARKRMEGPMLQSWTEADQTLREIGLIDIEIGKIEGTMNVKISNAKEAALNLAAPRLARKKELELALKEFTVINRGDIEGKTKTLTFGVVGFHFSTKIVVKKAADTVKLLKKFGHDICIKIKESVDKQKMKALTDEQLLEVGAYRKKGDTFGYEIDLAKIAEEAA